jgi:hypothetical protein
MTRADTARLMTEQHTPGPWAYNEYTRTIRGPHNHWLATMDSWDGAIDHAANARLIAAAPDLLAALQAVADYWAGGDVPEVLDTQMRAAIAKATGGQS